MIKLQVEGMEDVLYKALKQRAELSNRSLSQEVLFILKDFLSQKPQSQNATKEFLKLSGSWEGQETAEDLIKDLRKSKSSKRQLQCQWPNVDANC